MAEATPAPKPTSKKQRQRGPQLALDPPAGARRPHFPSISRQIPLAFPAWHCPWHPFPHIHRPPPVNLPSSARSLSPRRPSGGASSPAFVFRRRPCGPVFPRPQPRRASHLAPRLLLPSAVQPHPPPLPATFPPPQLPPRHQHSVLSRPQPLEPDAKIPDKDLWVSSPKKAARGSRFFTARTPVLASAAS